MTSNTPSPRIRPSSVAGIVASEASITAPSSEASEPGELACIAVPGPHFGQAQDTPPRGRHVVDRAPFAHRVVLVPSGEEVRGREPHLGQPGAVGPAADRLPDRLGPPRS